jgi:hypothetical protein
MSDIERIEKAERLGRSRSRVFFVLAIVFFIGQVPYFSNPGATRDTSFRIGAWLVLAILMLLLIATGGFLLRGRKVWDLLNDETSRTNLSASQAVGFWAAMIAALSLYVAAMFETVSLSAGVHIIVTAGVGSALLSFATRERRAHRIG